jgi:flavodoxin
MRRVDSIMQRVYEERKQSRRVTAWKGNCVKTVIVYNSVFGNTEQIARHIADAIPGTVKLVKVGKASPQEISGADMLVVGSPTVGGRATRPMQEFLDNLPKGIVGKVSLAAFDTRISMKFAQIFGYAAPCMAEALKQKGCAVKLPPEGFIVKRRNGPLADGELERASAWGKTVSRGASRRMGPPGE